MYTGGLRQSYAVGPTVMSFNSRTCSLTVSPRSSSTWVPLTLPILTLMKVAKKTPRVLYFNLKLIGFSSYTRVVERIYDIYEMDYRALGYKRSKDDDAAFVMHIFEFLGEECF